MVCSYEKHSSLILADSVSEICAPLKKLNIDYFVFVRIYITGERICLTNAKKWQLHYCKSSYYLKDKFALLPENYVSNYYTWNLFSDSNIYIDAKKNFDIEYLLTLVDKQCNYCDIFHFGKDKYAISSYEFCLNNLDLFHVFKEYFKEKAAGLIRSSDTFIFPELYIANPSTNIKTNKNFECKDIKLKFIEYTKIKRYYLGEKFKNIYLTTKEVECLRWLLIGKSTLEVGIILSMPKRTVEAHVNNIKNKLNCNKLSQVFYYLLRSPLAKLLII